MIIEKNGRTFRVDIERDDDAGAPWECEDGHGPVSEWTTRDKLPGELVLCEDRPHKRYYDFQEAVKIARREGWDTAPYGQGTKGERAARAAMADYERLRRWCNGDWYYCGVIVTDITDEDAETDYRSALWGIESDCEDYISGVAQELVDEALSDYARDNGFAERMALGV